MPIKNLRRLAVVAAGLLVSGCSYFTPMAETVTPDGRVVKAPAATVAQMEYNWSRENQLATLKDIATELLARPDSDGNVSEAGEQAYAWKQALVARDLKDMLGDHSTNPYDVEIVKSNNRTALGRMAMYVLAPPILNRVLYGEAGAVAQGGTYIKQNNTVEGSSLSNSGGLAGGPGGPGGPGAAAPGGDGGMVAGGPGAAAAGGEGAPGGGVTGGSRAISIGGIGNMMNSQDAYNGFQNRFNEILHGEGVIGKQPQAGFGDENQFSPVNDEDEGSVSLF